jgi:hypothetical protein
MKISRTADIVIFLFICALIAAYFSTDKPTATLTIITLGLASISIMISAIAVENSANAAKTAQEQAEKAFQLAETDKRKRDINESLNYFYFPVKDILDLACDLLTENHIIQNYNNDGLSLGSRTHASVFEKKMIPINTERLAKYKKENNLLYLTIVGKNTGLNQFLIHEKTTDDLKKIRQYRHLVKQSANQNFEIYLKFIPGWDLDNIVKYLKQKSTEITQLSKDVDMDIKNYLYELNGFSNEIDNKKQ